MGSRRDGEAKLMRKRGFTLIELLVVIAVIAILAAILFPVFISARESSKRSKCMSNLKNLGRAINLYADEWGGWLYPRIYNEYWGVGPDPIPRNAPATDFVGAYWRYAKNGQIFRCPFDTYVNPKTGLGTNGLPDPFKLGSGGIPERISYAYVGLDIWHKRLDGTSPPRNITDEQRYKGYYGTQGWVMRDKDFLTGSPAHLATVHGISPYPASDPRWLLGVPSNVLLFDGSVAWRRWWDG